MKIALCFKGLASGTSKANSPVVGFNGWDSIKKHVCQDHEYDVFLHSWSTDVEKDLIEIYQPKSYIIEPQMYFCDKYVKDSEKIKNNHHRKKTKKMWAPQIIRSHLYSLSKSIELKKDWENKNNTKYDITFVLRYDTTFWEDLDYGFIKDRDNILIHASLPKRASIKTRRDKNKFIKNKIWDLWWAASENNINILDEVFSYSMNHENLISIHSFYDEYFEYLYLEKNITDAKKIAVYPVQISEINKYKTRWK